MSALVDPKTHTRVLELTPEDMTVTVESGIALGALQRELEKHRQWLPSDPPNAETLSIHDLLAKNLSGPRRFGYGTIREHLIGMKVALADGRTIKSGGKVVKNVAGYDLAKLFIGARGSLGVIVEATFKLRPVPEMECFICQEARDLTAMKKVLRDVLDSELTPIVLDAHRFAPRRSADSHVRANPEHVDSAVRAPVSIVCGLAGTREEVNWQLDKARALGFTTDTSLDYESEFWSEPAPVNRISVLPSRITETIAELGERCFVARAGNGVIYFRGESLPQNNELPIALMDRIKNTYDPKNLLPKLSL